MSPETATTSRLDSMRALMKIRIGTILGIDGDSDPGPFNEAVTAMEDLGFDSLWLAELTSRPTPDPIIGLTRPPPARPG